LLKYNKLRNSRKSVCQNKRQVKNLLKYNKLRNCRKSVCQNTHVTWWLITLHVLYFTARTVHTKQSYNIIIIFKGFFSPLMIIVNALENSSGQLTTQTASSFSVGIINFLFQFCFKWKAQILEILPQFD